jgi:hypothetical protein
MLKERSNDSCAYKRGRPQQLVSKNLKKIFSPNENELKIKQFQPLVLKDELQQPNKIDFRLGGKLLKFLIINFEYTTKQRTIIHNIYKMSRTAK